ncbi:MAG: hypothetical protein JWP69_2243 [Flaviaesturariibacter sp.]|nr:hypothetical protein [Flaviaesturariibacter sp.]
MRFFSLFGWRIIKIKPPITKKGQRLTPEAAGLTFSGGPLAYLVAGLASEAAGLAFLGIRLAYLVRRLPF